MAHTKLFLILLLLLPEFAQADFSDTITVHAIVPAMRFIVIDSTGIIQEITSNSKQNTVPVIVRGNLDGEQVRYVDDSDIAEQYRTLLPNLDFSQPGIVYTRPQTNTGLGFYLTSLANDIVDRIRLYV